MCYMIVFSSLAKSVKIQALPGIEKYNSVEESVCRVDTGGYEDDATEDVAASVPSTILARRVLRVAHLSSGYRRKFDVEWLLRILGQSLSFEIDIVSVDVAIAPTLDLSLDDVLASLLRQVQCGHLKVVLAGPPCGTWSRARHNQRFRGPRPLRSRAEPWGRTDVVLSASEARSLPLASTLLRSRIALAAEVKKAGGVALIKHPADPGSHPYPSIWDLPAIRELVSEGATTISFEQCRSGLASQKATTLAIVGAQWAHEFCRQSLGHRCNHTYHHERLEGRRPDGSFKSSAAQTYPPSLRRDLARCIIAADSAPGGRPLELLSCASGARSPRTPSRGTSARASVGHSMVQGRPLAPAVLRPLAPTRAHQRPGTEDSGGAGASLVPTLLLLGLAVLVLVESMVALGAASKGRSSARALLRLCRQLVPITCVLNIWMLFRYAPSELNPTDGPSRGPGVGHAHRDRWAAPEASSSSWQLPPSSTASRP